MSRYFGAAVCVRCGRARSRDGDGGFCAGCEGAADRALAVARLARQRRAIATIEARVRLAPTPIEKRPRPAVERVYAGQAFEIMWDGS